MLAILRAIADDAGIAQQFREELGWSHQRESEGWALFNALKASSIAPVRLGENPAKKAMAACEQWQATVLVRVRAMLEATHPEQALLFFHDFVSGEGMVAVANASTFIQREAPLAHDKGRKATRKEDADVLAVIEAAGMTKAKLAALAKAVRVAQSAAEAAQVEAPPSAVEAARLDALRKIHTWVTMWSDMARTVITRRDPLIRLGIAKRRTKPKAVVVPPVVTPPVTPTSPVASPAPATSPASPAGDNGPESRAA